MGDEKKGEPEPGFMDKPWVVCAMQLMTCVMSIVSISSIVSANNTMKATAADVSNTVDNWQRVPVTDVHLVNYADACPAGYSEMKLGTWPGADGGACGCPTGASHSGKSYTSSSSSCSTNQTDAGCQTDANVGAIPLEHMKHSKVCVIRDPNGEAANAWTGSSTVSKARPNPTCPAGYQLCGTGTYSDGSATCAPNDAECPITAIVVSSTEATMAGYDDVQQFAAPPPVRLFQHQGGADELPIVEMDFVLIDGTKRGVCYEGDDQTFSGAADMGDYGQASIPSACAKTDPRFVSVGWTITTKDLLTENFYANEACTMDECAAAGKCEDFLATNVRCSETPKTDATCAMYGKTELNCKSTDTICNNIKYQSKCGKLTRFAAGASESVSFGIQYRRQIYWDPACILNQDEVYATTDELEKLVTQLNTTMIINILCNIFVGFLIPIFIV